MIEVLYKDKNAVIIHKPAGMPTQSDVSGDEDALTGTSRLLASLGEESDLWLIHRLDRVVSGLVVFARNKESAAELSRLVSGSGFKKEYFAVVEGYAESGEFRDYLFKDSRKSKAYVVNTLRKGAKEAVLEFESLAFSKTEQGVHTLVRIRLHTGRFHQIRAQFSSRGFSLVGDGKYGSHDNKAKMPALFSHKLEFTLKNKRISVNEIPNVSEYPWSLFNMEDYK